MCMNASYKDGNRIVCRKCDWCRSRRIRDWVGRALCEQHTSDHSVIWTLTYRGDGPETRTLDSSHVSGFIRSIRDAGFKVRFISAGEYGSEGGRAHWHVVTFHKGALPPLTWSPGFPNKRMVRFDSKFWPWGFVTAQQPDFSAYYYALKYMVKQQGASARQNRFSMSKRNPGPIGCEYLANEAARIVKAGLPLHEPFYQFADVKDRKGAARKFFLPQGAARRQFLSEYVRLWREAHGSDPPETLFLVEKYFDPIAKAEMSADVEAFEREIAARQKPYDIKAAAAADFASDGIDPFNASRKPVGILRLVHRASDGSDVPSVLTAFSDQTAELLLQDDRPYQIGVSKFSRLLDQLSSAGLNPRNAKRSAKFLADHWRVTVPLRLA